MFWIGGTGIWLIKPEHCKEQVDGAGLGVDSTEIKVAEDDENKTLTDKLEAIKIDTMKEHLVNMLKSAAEADRQKALLTLELLSNHAVGIGDHSTGDFYKNAEEAITMLVDADDRIAAVEKYLSK